MSKFEEYEKQAKDRISYGNTSLFLIEKGNKGYISTWYKGTLQDMDGQTMVDTIAGAFKAKYGSTQKKTGNDFGSGAYLEETIQTKGEYGVNMIFRSGLGHYKLSARGSTENIGKLWKVIRIFDMIGTDEEEAVA